MKISVYYLNENLIELSFKRDNTTQFIQLTPEQCVNLLVCIELCDSSLIPLYKQKGKDVNNQNNSCK